MFGFKTPCITTPRVTNELSGAVRHTCMHTNWSNYILLRRLLKREKWRLVSFLFISVTSVWVIMSVCRWVGWSVARSVSPSRFPKKAYIFLGSVTSLGALIPVCRSDGWSVCSLLFTKKAYILISALRPLIFCMQSFYDPMNPFDCIRYHLYVTMSVFLSRKMLYAYHSHLLSQDLDFLLSFDPMNYI